MPINPYVNGLPKINRAVPSATALQAELKRVGYLAQSVALSANYGPLTQAAVRYFYAANTDHGWYLDTQIGPLGWQHLQTEPAGSYPPAPPPSSMEPVHDYTRILRSGVTIDRRTGSMLNTAQTLAIGVPVPLDLIQGSWSNAAASAGTHSGGGAVDVNVYNLNTVQRNALIKALRQAGFAAWLRTPAESNWDYHIHAIAIGDRQMSTAAHDQVIDYFAGRNGLANNRADTAPSSVGRPYPSWAGAYR